MMNGKLKKAPNLTEVIKQTASPQHEILILVGENVWGFYRKEISDKKGNGTGSGWQLLVDAIDSGNPERYNVAPVILDERDLDKIAKMEILPIKHEVASLIDVSGFFAVKSAENGVTIRERSEEHTSELQ